MTLAASNDGRSLPRAVATLALIALAGLSVGRDASAQQSPGMSVNRPQEAQAPGRQAPRARPVDPSDTSADELNRRRAMELEAQARSEAEAQAQPKPPEPAQPGFFGRLFGSGSPPTSTPAPTAAPAAPVPTPAEATVDPESGRSVASVPTPEQRAAEAARTANRPGRAAPPSGPQIAQTPTSPPSALPVPLPPRPGAVPPAGGSSGAPGAGPVIQPPAAPTAPGGSTVLVPPPAAPPASTAAPVEEARPRTFGRNSAVPTESPTLQVEVGKGTIIKLKSPASTVFIANPDIADVQVRSANTIYIFGKKAGETVLYAVDDRERVLLNSNVTVTHQHGRANAATASLPGAGSVQASTVGSAVVLTGRATDPGAIDEARRLAMMTAGPGGTVINRAMLSGSNQVMLRVKIVEAQRESFKRLGINWETVFNLPGKVVGGLSTPQDLIGTGARLGSPAGGVLFGRYLKGGTDIYSLVDALAQENMLTVLAEPNLTAVSGETASFLAGGEFPIIISTGNGAYSIQFKQFGVSLAFTPTIMGGGRIHMRVKPEVSQLSATGSVNLNGFTVPGLTTRRVDTTVELGSGQSFAIAGLIQNNTQQDINKLPGLGDIPILGMLFKSDAFRRNESELVVIVTPYLVQPSNKQLSTPAEGFVPPTDADRYLYGRTHRVQGAGSAMPRGSRSAATGGFMVD
ncbi:MAG: pilus assembly protein N-terminal domain-containing protein [Rhodospirillales bacterium]|nr:MAG: pilus assembly protein N-terminal domain-containing protein [Rhodospirillales bacterium]